MLVCANKMFLHQTSCEFKFAGTSKNVLIQLVGKDGRASTEFLTLHNYFSNSFGMCQNKSFVIPAKDVGLPILIRISK